MTRLDRLEERLDLIDERIAKLEIEVYEEVSVLESTLAKVGNRVHDLEKSK